METEIGATGFEPEPEKATSNYEHCGYADCEMCRAANALHSGSFDWLRLALNGNDLQHGNLPPAVARIAESWSSLPPHIREAISALLDVGVASSNATRGAIASSVRTTTENLAWRIAAECREVVQPCLREEEWPDADREFAAIISAGLAAYK